jgi:hypothetical protein
MNDELTGPSPAPLLDIQLLDALEARWRAHGLPLLDRLRPGLTDDEMDTLTAPLGLRLPLEARRWWGWHDGVSSADVYNAREREVGVGMQFLPLGEAVELYRSLRTVILEDHLAGAFEPDPEGWWARAWFPVTERSGPIVCDCSVPEGEVTPIRILDWGALIKQVKIPRARSLGEVVGWWIEAFDVGAWGYTKQWVYEPELLREELEDSWLV